MQNSSKGKIFFYFLILSCITFICLSLNFMYETRLCCVIYIDIFSVVRNMKNSHTETVYGTYNMREAKKELLSVS